MSGTPTSKGSDLLVRALEREGVQFIFGCALRARKSMAENRILAHSAADRACTRSIPGEENLDFLESLRQSHKIKLIVTRHGALHLLLPVQFFFFFFRFFVFFFFSFFFFFLCNFLFKDRQYIFSKFDFDRTSAEQAAGFMAATIGRLTGKIGVCLSTLGPGATNFSTAVAYAHLGGFPCLFITGQKPIRASKQGRFQIVDIVDHFGRISKKAVQV